MTRSTVGTSICTGNNLVPLTPDTFHRLDQITRSMAGRPLCVFDYREVEQRFAYVSAWMMGVYDCTDQDEGPRLQGEKGVIHLANAVDIDEVRAMDRPEIDLGFLDKSNVWDYLVLHEVAHVINRDAMFQIDLQFRTDFRVWKKKLIQVEGKSFLVDKPSVSPEYHGVFTALEMEADRMAWGMLCPGKLMPVHGRRDYLIEDLEAILQRFEVDRLKEGKGKAIIPLDTNPLRFVPSPHVTEGIPWLHRRGDIELSESGFKSLVAA